MITVSDVVPPDQRALHRAACDETTFSSDSDMLYAWPRCNLAASVTMSHTVFQPIFLSALEAIVIRPNTVNLLLAY